MIDVAIRAPDLAIAGAWEDLARRAAPNVFMAPAALCAAQATGFAHIHVLLAYAREGGASKLVGAWALQEVNIVPFWPPLLAAPAFNYGFLSSPMVDPDYMEAVIPALLAAVASDPALPNVIRLSHLDGEDAACAALCRQLAANESATLTLRETQRPYVTRASGLKSSGSTRKKLRQDWNRLSALGNLALVNDAEPEAVCAAFETFLALEAASWKGEQGTALLCDVEDATFARRLIGELAAHGQASVALLRLDDKAVAAQVLMRCGRMAYTWKTAFDAAYAKYSPGMLLIDKLTEQLFAGGEVEAIESCSPEGSFMQQLWTGRRATIDMLVDVGAHKSLNFVVAALGARGYNQLREIRNRLRAAAWLPRPRKKGLVPSR